jgi:hypothetical protein
LLFVLLHWQGQLDLPRREAVVETTIWTPSPARATAEPAAAAHAVTATLPRHRPGADVPRDVAPSTAPSPATPPTPAWTPMPAGPPSPTAGRAIAVAPPASAPSAVPPLRLTLTRAEIRALEAEEAAGRTLAQRLAGGPRPSALSQVGSDDEAMSETPLPGGVTEEHVHGNCFRMVPTLRSQSDPFNHGGERLTGPCLPNF